MNRKYIFSISALLLIFAISCKDKLSDPEIIEYKIDNKPEFTLRLIDQGKEPRKILKYEFKKGSKDSRKMISVMEVQNTMDGKDSPAVNMPILTIPITTVVQEVDPSGVAKINYEIKEILVTDDEGVDPNLTKSLKELYGKFELISCTGEMTPSGTTTKPECEFKGDIKPNIVGSIKQLMENFSNNIFLPKEPVGVGAKWEIINPNLTSGGIVISFESTYQLVNLEGNRAVIDSITTQSAKDQTVTFPGSEYQTRIASLNAKGSGSMNIDFSEILPTGSGNSETEVKTIVNISDSKTSEIVTHMLTGIKITDK